MLPCSPPPAPPAFVREPWQGLILLSLLALLCTPVMADLPKGTLATVGDISITRREVNLQLGLPPDARDPVAPNILYGATQQLVDQQLLARAASSQNLQKQAETEWIRTRDRDQVLALAYLKKQHGMLQRPSEAEISQFIQNRPELFGARQVYHLHRIALQSSSGPVSPKVLEHVQRASVAQMQTLHQDLRTDGVRVQVVSQWSASEQIEPEVLSAVQQMKDGDVQRLPGNSPSLALFVQRLAAHADPIRPEEVRASIGQGMFQERVNRRNAEVIASLRKNARITLAEQASVPTAGWAAQVNGQTIPKSALNPEPEHDEAFRFPQDKGPLLQALIDQTLLAQAAMAEGLHLDAVTAEQLRAIESGAGGKRLLELERLKAQRPTRAEVERHIEDNPLLFSKREVHRYVEILIDENTLSGHEKLQKELRNAQGGVQGIVERIRQLGWRFAIRQAWDGPERLQPEYREPLQRLIKGGHLLLPHDGRNLTLLYKLDSFADPLPGAEALRLAYQTLLAEEAERKVQRLLVQLRASGSVKYSEEIKAAGEAVAQSGGWRKMGPRQWLKTALLTTQTALTLLWPAALVWLLWSVQSLSLRRVHEKFHSDGKLHRAHKRPFTLRRQFVLMSVMVLATLAVFMSYTTYDLLDQRLLPRLIRIVSLAIGLLIPMMVLLLVLLRLWRAGYFKPPAFRTFPRVFWAPVVGIVVAQSLLLMASSMLQ